jgi:microtubule-associated protein 1
MSKAVFPYHYSEHPMSKSITMKNMKTTLTIAAIIVSGSLGSGCSSPTPKPTPAGADAINVLKAAEADAKAGNADKAIKEIDKAEKDLIAEDKAKPIAQPTRGVSGQNAKEVAEADAIQRLEKAKGKLKAKLDGEAADEVNQALKDVKTKETSR